ncbi:MAG TPA: 3-phosphoshikimate 1-carboxyvinyltransferase [Bacteroidota bacterium]|nr:3-phosphoshikimate 1-carboxyvinyltransferase [Bacteroidota bacterium]
MPSAELRKITPVRSVNARIHLPPSKSYTNRALIAAALADGDSKIHNYSKSDDSCLLIAALRDLGIKISERKHYLEISGTNGIISPSAKELNIGNAGTSMRFLTSLVSLAHGETRINGDERMRTRPIQDLLDGLRMAGIRSTSVNGCPPVTIHGGAFNGGIIELNASSSSQFLSSILLIAPYAKHAATVHPSGHISSLPYVDMTLHVMREFGAVIDFIAPSTYIVSNSDRYVGHEMTIESDASSATYFLAAAAIAGGKVEIANLTIDSLQGDIRFLDILKQMGSVVGHSDNSVELHSAGLFGIEIDMNELPDCVPTLAVLAAFAEGPSVISNVAHLRYKETNRLEALAVELKKLGAGVDLTDDSITIHPRPLHGAVIETYNDHRMAMSFALAGLRVPDVRIANPMCVTKSFPGFWEEFSKLETKE